MARDLYHPSAFYLIVNRENEIFQAGLRIISNPEKYENLLKGIGAQSVRVKEELCGGDEVNPYPY